MTDQTLSQERHAQKSRTREAILSAARMLIAEGIAPTVPAAAERAGVSRATAYRYFSDPNVLAAEAGLDVTVNSYESVTAGADTTRDRLLAVTLYFFDLAVEHEAEFRSFLAHWLGAWQVEGKGISRGARRIAMLERALSEDPREMDPATARQLVLALTAATGTEAMIALRDIARADHKAARESVAASAGILIDHYLTGPSGT